MKSFGASIRRLLNPHQPLLRNHAVCFGAGSAMLCAALAFYGWFIGSAVVTGGVPGIVPMNPATAVCIWLGSVALIAKSSQSVGCRRVAQTCACLIASVGLAKLSGYIFNYDVGFDHVLFGNAVAPSAGQLASRMSPHDAVNLMLIGASLGSLGSESRRTILAGQTCAIICAVSALFALLGYAYGVPALFEFRSFPPIAVQGAMAFAALAIGALASQPGRGIMSAITDPGVGGVMARRFLPTVLLFPALLGSLYIAGERAGLYGAQLGLAFLVLSVTVAFAALICIVSRVLCTMEHRGRRTADALVKEREFLTVVLENTREGITACDANGVLTVFNRATRGFHGLPKRAIPPERWAEHYDFYRADGVTPMRMEEVPLFCALKGESVRDAELVIAPPHMPMRRLLASGQALFDPHGCKLGAVVVTHDITESKIADEALRQSEERLRSVITSAPLMLWAIDRDGVFTFSEGSALHLVGMEPGAVVGKSVFEIYRDVPELCAACRAALEGEEIHTTVNLTGLILDLRLTPTCEIEGSVTGVIGVATDITERRRMEEALRESHAELETRVAARTAELLEANQRLQSEMAERELAQAARRQIEDRLQAIVDNAPAVIFVKDLAGRYLLVNREFERVFGMARQQIIGRRDHDILPLEQADAFARSDRRVCEANAPAQFEELIPRDDSLHTFFTVKFPLCGGDGGPYAVCGISTDITDTKRSRERLRESEERFALLVDGVEDYGIFMLDPRGHVQSWNRGAQRLNGYRAEEITGRHFSCFFPSHEMPEGGTDAQLRAAETSGRFAEEGWRVRKDGSRFLANVVITALRDERGKLRGFANVTRDITALREAEQDLIRAKQHAELANDAKSKFLSRISHELRTPLNAILGFGQLLEMDELGGQQGDSIAAILRAGEQLVSLVDEVLAISSAESDGIVAPSEPVSVGWIVQDALEGVQCEAAEHGIQLLAETAESEPEVSADPHRLKQVLTNLLSNAVKYNRENGTVTIWTEPAPAARRHIHVKDTGLGIPLEKVERLFTPFERLDAEERGITGVGLGLSVARSLVQAMDGSVTVKSVPGEGCTFTVTLPVAEWRPAADPTTGVPLKEIASALS